MSAVGQPLSRSDGRLKVLADFDSLDDLIDSTQSQSGHQA